MIRLQNQKPKKLEKMSFFMDNEMEQHSAFTFRRNWFPTYISDLISSRRAITPKGREKSDRVNELYFRLDEIETESIQKYTIKNFPYENDASSTIIVVLGNYDYHFWNGLHSN